jgi:hypothetical protein
MTPKSAMRFREKITLKQMVGGDFETAGIG